MHQQRLKSGKEAPRVLEGQFKYLVPGSVGRTWLLPEPPASFRVAQFYEVERTQCTKN